MEYHAEDVQRVADAITDGTAVLEPGWRRDTELGQELLHRAWQRDRRQYVREMTIQGVLVSLFVLAFLGFVVFAAIHG